MDFSGEQPQYGVYRMLTQSLPKFPLSHVGKKGLSANSAW